MEFFFLSNLKNNSTDVTSSNTRTSIKMCSTRENLPEHLKKNILDNTNISKLSITELPHELSNHPQIWAGILVFSFCYFSGSYLSPWIHHTFYMQVIVHWIFCSYRSLITFHGVVFFLQACLLWKIMQHCTNIVQQSKI